MAAPNPVGSTGTIMTDVACGSVNSCFAVGFYFKGPKETNPAAVIERWNGHSWSINPLPTGATATAFLTSVSCPSAVSCFAVGGTSFVDNAAIEHWDGNTWSSVTVSDPSSATGLLRGFVDAVSCLSPISCTGFGVGAGVQFPHWDGSSWTVQPGVTPTNPDPTHDLIATRLAGVACASSNSCFAVGYYEIIDFSSSTVLETRTLAEHWDGASWTLATIPAANSTFPDSLNDVACPATNSCFIVGGRSDGSPLVEHWNGAKWSILANVKKGVFGSLESVSCANAKSCLATGYANSNAHDLVDRWDGKAWSITTSPNPKGTTAYHVGGVSCPKPTTCFSVGSFATDKQPTTGSWYPRYKPMMKRYA